MVELEFDITMKQYEELVEILELAEKHATDIDIRANARHLLKIFKEKD